MCVAVTLEPGAVLTEQEVIHMDRANADGVGIAWARDGLVEWYKTTKVDPAYVAKVISSWKEYPRLVHFRLRTAGETIPQLCHPFEIGPAANCSPKGQSTRVMIHNGHWNRWTDVRDLLAKEGLLPDGPWSDSRLVAFLAHKDPEWLQILGGRVAIMQGDGRVERLGSWETLRDGVQVSNKNWEGGKLARGQYSGWRQWSGWGWSEEEVEAFFKEQETKDRADQEKAIKEAEDEYHKLQAAKRSKRAKKEEKRGEKLQRREERRAASAQVAGLVDKNCECGPEDSHATGKGDGSTDSSCPPAQQGDGIIRYSPTQSSSGKWYAVEIETVAGRRTDRVVEVAAPGIQGQSR